MWGSLKTLNPKTLTLAEAVVEAALDCLHVAHAPRAGGLAADGLHAPIICAEGKGG